ncbi:hypothetical protein SAMN02745673_01177 [Marinactinospora thermotolerans DSM 45154]|uniref:Uncharacterized protein n=1 Tax=Marinactinospora thermotolerans DSM 45154 TaxID=1122192 RepID=A0A1T4MXQ6_9ACTN|nr:hypothetical protein SAMN02745673_01177 [Marinactinospora thermotolerans DSM 45154]
MTAAPVALLIANALVAVSYLLFVFGDPGENVFCGSPSAAGYADCVDQMTLFAIASLIPAMLALILMVAAFITPGLRERPGLRAQTLGYSLIAWVIAGSTFVLGGLPSV